MAPQPRVFHPHTPSWHMVPLLRLTLKVRTLCAGDMKKCWRGVSVESQGRKEVLGLP